MKKAQYILQQLIPGIIICLLAGVNLISCSEPEMDETTTSDLNITPYLKKHNAQFSEFLKILNISGNAGFLGAYGTYTCFAPTNEAVQAYLGQIGVGSVEEISPEELKKLVRFHVLSDTISTALFNDGRIQVPTMYGQYLTTGAINIEGISYIRVNRQAEIVQGNIRCGNGLIHAINHMLTPASFTLAQLIEKDAAYSIFTEAMKETGWFEALATPAVGDPDPKWYTLIAQTNAVFNAAGINSYQELKQKYSHLNDPRNPADSLYLFVAYRVLPEIKYLTDLITASSHPTMAPKEVITTRISEDSVLINADLVNGIQEQGTYVERERSDISATNGVLHAVAINYKAKVRKPFAVYWDVCDQPEMRKMTGDFRRPGKGFELSDIFKDIDWVDVNPLDEAVVNFQYATMPTGSGDRFYFGDHFKISVRPSFVQYVEFTTPLLARGTYKVWICYRRQNYNDFQAFFNGEPLPRIFGLNPGASYPGGTDAEAEAAGWKLYTEPTNTSWLGRLLGTVRVESTGRHKFKIVSLTNRGGGTGNPLWIDMVHFIPSNMEQVWPRFRVDGTRLEKP
jgi:uncharacterized surface protein with fasciclin (FAS1) repeats